MELFSAPEDCASHCIRIVLAEKNLGAEVVDVEHGQAPEDLIELNPYQSVPTLVDRDLVLYDYRVIMEYLDERFPHPPLLPPDPVNRARSRLTLNRIDQDWYHWLPRLELARASERREATKRLGESLSASSAVFAVKPFFLSDEFSLLDCSLAPLLWRLPHYGIKLLPSGAKTITEYAERLFARPAFQRSLSPVEKAMPGV